MKYLNPIFILFLLAFPLRSGAQLAPDAAPQKSYAPLTDSLTHRIILIGDAGQLDENKRHPVVEAVEKLIPMDKRTTVLFLGDNLYRHGLPYAWEPGYDDARAVLDSQANLADYTPGMVYMMPGNHDWMQSGPGGWEAVLRQEQYINSLNKPNLKFVPGGGCPGPIEVKLGDDVVIIIMDTQWWLHPYDKPGIESDCPQKTKQEVLEEIKDIVKANFDKLVIFAAHNPFKSKGPHGGYYTVKQHIFPFTDMNPKLYIPLPVLGSIYPITRSVFGTLSDLKYPDYVNMINAIEEILNTHAHVIRVGGHEHNLQWIQTDSNKNYIVSGAGSKHNRVSKSRELKFGTSSNGFAVLDVFKNKDVQISFFTASSDSFGQIFTGKVLNFKDLPVLEKKDTTEPIIAYKYSVFAPVSTQYEKTSWFKRFFQGNNYRKEWSTPVLFPTFDLKKTNGGFTIDGMGGGMQTKSLHLIDKNGEEWSLRTVDKDPAKAIPTFLRASIAEEVVQDMISASHPYGALAVPPLADAANVLAPKPTYYFVPDDPDFGYYRPLFASKIGMLERKEPVSYAVEKTISTSKLFNKMRENSDHVIDQQSLLRARLIDMLIADWDRHFDQWRWARLDTGKGKLYYPIPRDRDQVFFNSDGLLMKTIGHRFFPWMRGFHKDIDHINELGYSARDLDRLFLNKLDEAQWSQTIDSFLICMNDETLNQAVHAMPPEIVAIGGPDILEKLKSRRSQLKAKALKYYRFISKTITYVGSNEDEFYSVTGNDSGALLQIYTRSKKDADTNMLLFSRQIDPRVTKEVRLYGLNGNDFFYEAENVPKGIRFRYIGGRGNDTFDVRSRTASYAYDISYEENPVLNKRHLHRRFSTNPLTNEYTLPDYQYNITRFPWINLGYNPDDGVLAGIGFYRRTYGFHKEPFETEHRLSTLFAFAQRAFQIRYQGTFVGVRPGYSLKVATALYDPALSNFFGLGNETERQPGLSMKYYRARYKMFDGEVLAQRSWFGKATIGIGPMFQYYWYKDAPNEGKVLSDAGAFGLDPERVHQSKLHVGGKLQLSVNNINNELFPTRGVDWQTSFIALSGLSKNAHPITRLQSDMNIYASLSDPAKLVAVLRFGGGKIFSKNFEYYQALGVGANNYLRGFRKNRFAGDAMAYGSIELRAKLTEFRNKIIPGSFGLVGFDDIGRVWMSGEDSRKWHNTWGGGVYFIPYNLFIVSLTATKSTEEVLFNVTIGTKLNLTF